MWSKFETVTMYLLDYILLQSMVASLVLVKLDGFYQVLHSHSCHNRRIAQCRMTLIHLELLRDTNLHNLEKKTSFAAVSKKSVYAIEF